MLKITFKTIDIFKLTGIGSAILLVCLIFIGMILELIGIALIIPILSFFINPETFSNVNFLKNYIDPIYLQNSKNYIYLLIILIVSLYLFKNIFLFLISFLKFNILNNIQVKISNELYKFYINANYNYHLKKNSAYLIRNLTNEIPNTKSLITQLINFYTELLVIIFLTAFLIYANSWLGFFTFITLFLSGILLFVLFKKFIKDLGKIRIVHAGHATKQIIEGLGGIKDVKILSKEDVFINKYFYFMSKFNRSDRLVLTLGDLPRLIFELIAIFTMMSIILIMSNLNYNQDKILVSLSIFALCLIRMIPSFNRLILSMQTINYQTPSFEKIYQLIIKKEDGFNFGTHLISKKLKVKFESKIEFKNISFSYDNKIKILDNINLTINASDTIGIYGASGSGKTTLINIILGFMMPTVGKITFDSKEINSNEEFTVTGLGHVPQNIYLIDSSIKENIAFGIQSKEIDNIKLNKCIKLSRLDNFIKDLEHGSDTIIGENGIRLSGGQRQRIGIARALYNNPNILIFDEATNSLDSQTEIEIMKDIYKLGGNYTILIISHNLETLKSCNRVYEVKNKKIIKIK